MYRDSANALDERDHAVGAILISEALVDECERAALVIRRPETGASHHERWRTITDVHDTYPEIWRHLDRARSLLATRGANTAAYDEMRPHARRAPTSADGTVDVGALHDARRAIEDLKLAVPGADWSAIHRRTAGLVAAPLGRARGQRAIMFAIIIAFLLALTGWLIALIPEHKEDPRAAMRRELGSVSLARKTRIAVVTVELGRR